MTLSNGIFSALLTLCEGNPPVTGGFPSQRTVTRNLMFSLIGVWTNGWTNNCDAGDLKRHGTHYEVTVMEAPDLNIHKPASPSCWGKCWMRVFCWSNFAAQYVFIHVLLLFVMEHLRSWTRTEIHIFFFQICKLQHCRNWHAKLFEHCIIPREKILISSSRPAKIHNGKPARGENHRCRRETKMMHTSHSDIT